MTIIIDDAKRREINIEVKLHINQKLFEKGFITEEMYQTAKAIILKG